MNLGLDSTLRDKRQKKARVWVFVEAGEPGLSFVSNLVQKDSVPCLLFLATWVIKMGRDTQFLRIPNTTWFPIIVWENLETCSLCSTGKTNYRGELIENKQIKSSFWENLGDCDSCDEERSSVTAIVQVMVNALSSEVSLAPSVWWSGVANWIEVTDESF